MIAPTQKPSRKALPTLTLAALGVVFGDIGTSPLYAFKQCLTSAPGQMGPSQIIGVLSLVFWSLVLVVCIMYLGFILRADHDGEGGTLALLGLVRSRLPQARTQLPTALTLLVVFGSALLFGDGVITPSISVLSAVEGLDVVTKAAHPFILPLAVIILLGLFLLQPKGTGSIGSLFGPVMVLWFGTIGILGAVGIAHDPVVLEAINPLYAIRFLFGFGWFAFAILGAVVLCFSGVEALFADLGHFGRQPIQLAWYGLVFPSLILNYFGQGAYVLGHPWAVASPFYALAPSWAVYPLVGLSTVATVIASQALISGVFSLTEQAVHMGICPRLAIFHTSKSERGQIYVPMMNISLAIACVAITLGFRSSDHLGNAYGLAVIGTMTITSITYFVVLRRVWKWPLAGTAILTIVFLIVDLSFLAGSVTKILAGAWVPLVIGVLLSTLLTVWITGRALYFKALSTWSMPIDAYRATMDRTGKVEGTGVFLTSDPEGVPLVGKHEWLRRNLCHENVVLLTIHDAVVPYVSDDENIRTEILGPGLTRVHVSFGFTQTPDVPRSLQRCKEPQLNLDWSESLYYMPRPSIHAKGAFFRRLFQRTYSFLARNALSQADYFHLPPDRVVYVGCELSL